MSHYGRTPVLGIKDLDEACAALAELGLEFERHAEPVTLYDYCGSPRPEVAHVVVRRHHTGLAASNDIGFVRRSDGVVEAIISDYDRLQKYDSGWALSFAKECGVQRALLRARRMGHRATRSTDARGRPRVEIMGRF